MSCKKDRCKNGCCCKDGQLIEGSHTVDLVAINRGPGTAVITPHAVSGPGNATLTLTEVPATPPSP